MKLPTYLTTVTSLSKIVALVLFIALPFIGFYFGIQYQKNIGLKEDKIDNVVVNKIITTPTLK